MRERVMSLETEYAVSFSGTERSAPEAREIVGAFEEALVGRYGVEGSSFLLNGSRFYYDVGHAEWSLPECRTAREAALYDKAADATLAGLTPEVQDKLEHSGANLLRVIKNNVDPAGNSYGCHENYQTEAETMALGREEQLRLVVRCLVPFLVSRVVVCGSGRVGLGSSGQEAIRFQLSQRADFINSVVSKDTRRDRALVNISKEQEPLGNARFRRLHLILGDANLSGFATFLKLGTTALVLRMIEDLAVPDIPALVDPVGAFRTFSRDVTCSVRWPCRDGTKASACEIQRRYLDAATRYTERHGASLDEQELLAEWRRTLDALDQDPSSLVGRLDWTTKLAVLDRYLLQKGMAWEDVRPGSPEAFDLMRLDIEYHDLSVERGLFRRLLGGRLDSMADDAAVLQAAMVPPAYTRAKVRGDLVALARDAVKEIGVENWDRVTLAGTTIVLDDPLSYFSPDVHRILVTGSSSAGRSLEREPDVVLLD